MNIIEFQAVDYYFGSPGQAAQGDKALNAVSLTVGKGEFVTLLGGSGSGKSTLLKLCNALLLPTAGTIRIAGMATDDTASLWEVRRIAGMVFPNSDDQIIGATVAEDVAFGPENLGLAPPIIETRVAAALQAVELTDLAESATHLLSRAQKLRVVLAGILAMQPGCILLDDAVALLEPSERVEFLSLLLGINRTEGVAVVQATCNSEEAAFADRIIVLAEGGAISC